MALGGDTLLDVIRNGLLPDQELVFNWLTRHGVRWRVYAAGLPFLTLMPKMWPLLLSDRFRPLVGLSFDAQHESDATWPQVKCSSS
jgi:phospholipase C